MKTTIDLPDDLLHRAKIAAAERKTTLKDLVVTGLESALKTDSDFDNRREVALARLQRGFRFKGKLPRREELYDRKPIS